MTKRMIAKTASHLLPLLLVLVMVTSASGSATIVIENGDGPGVGFNDPAPVAPVGENGGTTLGQQRLNAFQFAANLWGATLTSNTTIVVRSTWEPLTCTSTSAALGSAGTVEVWRDFPGSPFPGTWYGSALANSLSGNDLNPGTAEIRARFNVNLGNAGCLDGIHWYYGLDNNHGSDVDLVSVLLHEFSHGLGFQTFTNSGTGAQLNGLPTIYDRFLFDNTTAKTWLQMTDAERQASAINTQKLAWNGPQVTSDVHSVLGTPLVRVNSPPSIAGTYQVGTASFGPPLSAPGITANLIQALDPADGSGPSTTDGCSPLTNAVSVSGKLALVDRGSCNFTVKVKNAQNAGALGVIVVNNVSGSPPNMGGADPTITIPSAAITQADGNTIKAQLGVGVNVTLGVDASVPSGTDPSGRPLLFTPNPVQAGSSVSHWDPSTFPNQLMEPNISDDLSHSVSPPQDLTSSLLHDVGWITTGPSSTTVQFSASDFNVTEGNTATLTVTRSGTSGSSSVDFITGNNNFADCQIFNGTALANCDFTLAAGRLTFNPGETSKTIFVLTNDDVNVEGNETFPVTLSNAAGATIGSPGTASVTIVDNDSVGAPSVPPKQFVANLTGAQEVPATGNIVKGNGGVLILSNDETTGILSLFFSGLSGGETGAHVHGPASAGQNANILFQLPLGSPIINFTLSPNPTAQQIADLKAGLHYINIHSTGFQNGEIRGQLLWNPVEEAPFFVTQQYYDFLSRAPDANGFAYWTDQIIQCGSDVVCLRNRRIAVSDAFFFEPESQATAGYVYRIYKAALGINPTFAQFQPDRAQVVGGAGLDQSKTAFALNFVQRPAFVSKYPTSMSADAFVDAILLNITQNSQVDLSSQRSTLIGLYDEANTGRAAILRQVADSQAFIDAEYNRLFVLNEYFAYLRRDPDVGGYNFWLGQVNRFPLRDPTVQHAMVCSFITSAEYQLRFGGTVTRDNNECPQ